MKQSTNVSVNRGLHNRDIRKIRKYYHLFLRITSPCGDVRIVESSFTDSSVKTLSAIFSNVFQQIDSLAHSHEMYVGISRFHCSRYKNSYPISDYLTDLSYLDNRYFLDSNSFVLAYCEPFALRDDVAKYCFGESRIDFVVKSSQSFELCK